jgi:cell division protein FtsL
MSNLAYKVQQKNLQNKEQQVEQKQLVIKRGKITSGEKLLWTAAIILFLTGAILVVSNYATIYNINKSIQTTDIQIQAETEIVNDLTLQVNELSAPERIRNIAMEKLGMSLDSKNVKVLNQ